MWWAFPLVLISTVLTALVAFYVFPYGWGWYQCLTLGCILAATDPVAVSALLNEVGAPPRLKIHVSGESLLNDGSAVVFFFVFGGLFLHELGIVGLGQDTTVAEGFKLFFRMAGGGFGIGLAFALALRLILYKLDRRMEKEETVLQVAATVTIAYLSFFVSEVVAGCSGVIAVVTTGIFTKAFAGGLISDWTVMDSFWSLLEHLLNTVIFALGGAVFGAIIIRPQWKARDWGLVAPRPTATTYPRHSWRAKFSLGSMQILPRSASTGTATLSIVFASSAGMKSRHFGAPVCFIHPRSHRPAMRPCGVTHPRRTPVHSELHAQQPYSWRRTRHDQCHPLNTDRPPPRAGSPSCGPIFDRQMARQVRSDGSMIELAVLPQIRSRHVCDPMPPGSIRRADSHRHAIER